MPSEYRLPRPEDVAAKMLHWLLPDAVLPEYLTQEHAGYGLPTTPEPVPQRPARLDTRERIPHVHEWELRRGTPTCAGCLLSYAIVRAKQEGHPRAESL